MPLGVAAAAAADALHPPAVMSPINQLPLHSKLRITSSQLSLSRLFLGFPHRSAGKEGEKLYSKPRELVCVIEAGEFPDCTLLVYTTTVGCVFAIVERERNLYTVPRRRRKKKKSNEIGERGIIRAYISR